MGHESKCAIIRCEDHAEILVFDRTVFSGDFSKGGDELFGFSIKDSYIEHRDYQGILGRFRRAWNAFFDKPIVYADIIATDRDRVRMFLMDCLDIVNDDGSQNNHNTEQQEQGGVR